MPQNKPLLRFIKDYKRLSRLLSGGTVFCAFDTETTGLSSHTDRVIELGAVTFCMQPSGICVLDTFNCLVNPERPLPPICSELSHITDSMVRDAPVMKSVLPDFLRFIDGSILVAHNAPFDMKFMNAESERAGFPPLSNLCVDTLRMSRTLLPANGHWNLQFLAKQFAVDVHAAHRACDDARVCMEIMLHLLALPSFPRPAEAE